MTQPLTVGSLFSGIGGIELGLEAGGGFCTRWHSEIEPYRCEVLAKHWPGIPNHGDITAIDWAGVERVDLVCGGFPCQDISLAGKGAGIHEGTRSGLWVEFARCLGVLRPSYALIENVAALAVRGLDTVLADLAALGYDAEWTVVRAADVGAPHRRARLFVVAYSRSGAGNPGPERAGRQARADTGGSGTGTALADADFARQPQSQGRQQGQRRRPKHGDQAVADSEDGGLEKRRAGRTATQNPETGLADETLADAPGQRRCQGRAEHETRQRRPAPAVSGGIFQPIPRSTFWDDCDYVRSGDGALRPVKPGVRLLADGIPRRVAKLSALGDAVVPQVAEYLGRCILDFHRRYAA